MTVISRPGRPLAMVCDRCGCEWERPATCSSDIVRIDAQMHGWTYAHPDACPDRDVCPGCDGEWGWLDELAEATRDATDPDDPGPLDDQHHDWILDDERLRDE